MRKKKPNRVGVTGGIASGKTTVATLFSVLGVPIYSSDLRAKEIIHNNSVVKSKLIQEFGQDSYKADGSYNVAYISDIVFQDKEKLNRLNQIVHPAVFQDQEEWFRSLDTPYAIIESALLYEAKKEEQFDTIIVVAADLEVRLDRIIKRDGKTKSEAVERINHQMPQEKKVKRADFVVWNNGTESLIQQVMKIDQEIGN